MPPDLIAFFDHYRETLNQFDWFGIAALYDNPATIASGGAPLVFDEHAIRRSMQTQMNGYLESGFEQAEYTIGSYLLQGEQFAVVDLEWRLSRKHKPQERFRSTYNLRRLGDSWKIMLATIYEEP
jgi:hypothetical protein